MCDIIKLEILVRIFKYVYYNICYAEITSSISASANDNIKLIPYFIRDIANMYPNKLYAIQNLTSYMTYVNLQEISSFNKAPIDIFRHCNYVTISLKNFMSREQDLASLHFDDKFPIIPQFSTFQIQLYLTLDTILQLLVSTSILKKDINYASVPQSEVSDLLAKTYDTFTENANKDGLTLNLTVKETQDNKAAILKRFKEQFAAKEKEAILFK